MFRVYFNLCDCMTRTFQEVFAEGQVPGFPLVSAQDPGIYSPTGSIYWGRLPVFGSFDVSSVYYKG